MYKLSVNKYGGDWSILLLLWEANLSHAKMLLWD